MKAFGYIFALICMFIIGPIWGGYVLSVLWAWFIAPSFHAPQLSIALAIGVNIVVNLFTAHAPQESSEKPSVSKTLVRSLSFTFIYPLFALGFGAIVHMFA